MEESNNYGHQHPLLLILNEDQLIHNQSDITDCSRCAEKVSTPCFCCAEHCGLYLHKSRAFPLFILLGEGEMEESNNYGHQHPLLLILNQDQLIHNQSGVTHCSRCGEKVSAPCFCCAEHCGFYLHKVCAEAPLELNHPFHPHHPLLLLQNAPYSSGRYICNFCDKGGTINKLYTLFS
ncbi:uncharacterized protein [Gossypium hirsutum]|uniref:Uncharacterized protein isoform X3 n=1 Tax=Gossypium hirsutum TaxID=3635 RepID=A0ABM2ZMQ3_GOSHI|nr:uncharacterized protein LOC107943512 isoform X3 [Gossypium hirsutum]